MAKFYWTKGKPPIEVLELMLCRDVYHCTPLELAEVPLHYILPHLVILEQEAAAQKAESKKKKAKSKGKSFRRR